MLEEMYRMIWTWAEIPNTLTLKELLGTSFTLSQVLEGRNPIIKYKKYKKYKRPSKTFIKCCDDKMIKLDRIVYYYNNNTKEESTTVKRTVVFCSHCLKIYTQCKSTTISTGPR